jgi:hypothetical protein
MHQQSRTLIWLVPFAFFAVASLAWADYERSGHYQVEISRFIPLSSECKAFVAAANAERERFLAQPVPGAGATEPLPLSALLSIQSVREPAWQALNPEGQEYLVKRVLDHLKSERSDRPAYWALQYAYFFDPESVGPTYHTTWLRLRSFTWGRLDEAQKVELTNYVLRAYRVFLRNGGTVKFLKASSPNFDNVVQFDRPAHGRPINDIPGMTHGVVISPVATISVDATDIDQLKPIGATEGFDERYILFGASLFRVAQRPGTFTAWQLTKGGTECRFSLAQ